MGLGTSAARAGRPRTRLYLSERPPGTSAFVESHTGAVVKQVISDEQRRWRAAHRHRLIKAERVDDVATIADDLVALHSSDPATVYLSAAIRMKRPSVAAIERALYDERSVVRHHAMRRTIWVMTPEVARLAHGAATAKVAAAERKRTLKALATGTKPGDVPDPPAWLDDAVSQVTALLRSRGPLTTRAIGKLLPDLVIPVTFGGGTKNPAALNAHTKVLQGAGFDAVLVRGRPSGTWNSAEYEWHVTQDWFGGPIAGLDEKPAAAGLLANWLDRFGPATETDITWWFGWTATLTRTSLAAVSAQEVQLEDGRAAWVSAGDIDTVPDPGPWVRLMPGLDPTTMGWKARDWYLDPQLAPQLFDRFGNAGPIVMVDGVCAGAWAQRPDGEIAYELTTPIDAEHQRLLDDAIADLATVLGDVVVKPRFPSPLQKSLVK